MAKKKISTAALKRLKEKGVKLNVVKKAERPAEINAAPKPIKQTKKPVAKEPVRELQTRQWELEIDSRDFQGFIKTLTITEI